MNAQPLGGLTLASVGAVVVLRSLRKVSVEDVTALRTATRRAVAHSPEGMRTRARPPRSGRVRSCFAWAQAHALATLISAAEALRAEPGSKHR